MKRKAIAVASPLAVSLMLLLAGCGEEPNPLLESGVVGFWESVPSGSSAMRNSLELLADSSAAKFIANAVDYRYTIEGDQLVLTPIARGSNTAQSPMPPVEKYTFSVAGDTLLKATDNRKVWLARRGEASGSPGSLVGDWRVARTTDALAIHSYERYTRDGRMLMRLPVRGNTGSYTLTGDSLTLEFTEERSRTLGFRIEGDRLQLLLPDKPPFSYIRAGDKAWYEHE